MSALVPEIKAEGSKRFITANKGLLDGLREHEICKSFNDGDVCNSSCLICKCGSVVRHVNVGLWLDM